MVKIKSNNTIEKEKLRCAIQVYWKKHQNSKNTEIAKLFNVSNNFVGRWKEKITFTNSKRKRKTKINRRIKRFLIKGAKNKFTGIEGASSRKLANKIRKKFSIKLCHTTVNNFLKKIFGKPKRATKTFYLRKKDKERRIQFAKMIKEKNIKGRDIFFTDEKRLLLDIPLNRQTNQIRLSKEGKKECIEEKGKIFEKVSKPLPKFSKGIMVAGGISSKGVGKLIFITGTMTAYSYLQTIKMYKEDIDSLGKGLYLQQDNATCHNSKKILEYMNESLPKKLDFWPPNSPDLSPIEELWGILEEKLQHYNFSTTEEMIKKILFLWNRVPKQLCKNLVSAFDKKIEKVIRDGERVNRRYEKNKKVFSREWKTKWNPNNNIERIVYNQKSVQIMKARKIKVLKSEIRRIQNDYIEAKKRYSLKNKRKIKARSKELLKFFNQQEKEMKSLFLGKIKEKKELIKKFDEAEEDELFKLFSLEEKINYIRLGKKRDNLNSNSNSSTKDSNI